MYFKHRHLLVSASEATRGTCLDNFCTYKVVIIVIGRCMEKFRPQRLKLDAYSYKLQEAWVHGFKAKN